MATLHNIWKNYFQKLTQNEDENKNIIDFSLATFIPWYSPIVSKT